MCPAKYTWMAQADRDVDRRVLRSACPYVVAAAAATAAAAAAAAAAAGRREAELRADAGADLDNHAIIL